MTIDAGFDGLDSNGTASLTGGDITITSAANGGDSPVDTNAGATLDGATLVANGTEITSIDQLQSGMGGGGMRGGPGGEPGGEPPAQGA